MKLRYKILSGFLVLFFVAIGALAFVISRTDPCGPPPAVAAGTETMRAVMARCYGGPEVLTVEDVARPVPADDELLVRVRAAAVNPLDWHYLRGSPYLMRLSSGLRTPSDPSVGVDFAGVVESVGRDVTRFEPGDEVFGGRSGAFAQYLTIGEDRAVARKPPNVGFDQAAAIPIAALTALQALREKGRLEAGQSVLINGASGGVGTYAVQIAKAMGAEVAGVCSTRNVEMVRDLGADRVFDYTREDYTESGEIYDLIVDMVGNHSLSANRSVLKTDGIMVLVGGAKGNWIAPLINPVKAMIQQPFVEQELVTLLAVMNQEDLTTVADLMAEGKIESVIDTRYPLEKTAEAIRHSESRRARGKIIIGMD